MNIRQVVLLIVSAVTLVLAVYILQARSLYRKLEDARQTWHQTRAVLEGIKDAESALWAHEAAVRGCAARQGYACAEAAPAAARVDAAFVQLDKRTTTASDRGTLHRLDSLARQRAAILAPRPVTLEAFAASNVIHSRIQTGFEIFRQAKEGQHTKDSAAYLSILRSCYFFALAAFAVLALACGVALLRMYFTSRRRMQAEGLARTTEDRYRILVDASDMTLVVTDPAGIITFASDNATILTGFSCDDLVGHPISEFLGHRRLETEPQLGRDREHTFINARGEEKWAAYRVTTARNSRDEIIEYRIVAWDVDREKRLRIAMEDMETSRRQQQNLFQEVIDNVPNMVYLKDLEGNYRVVNKHMRELLTKDQDVVGRRLADFLGQDEDARMRRADEDVVTNKLPVSFEEHYLVDGEDRYFWEVKFPIFDANGAVRYVGGIATDITRRRREEMALREAKAEAESARQAQEQFMAAMSHEIRTPMNGIVGMANLLMGTRLNGEQREFTETIIESARNLLSLINDLLDFSKIESGKFEFERTPFRLRHALKKAIHPLRFKAEEKGVKLDLHVDDDTPEVLVGDPMRLQQVIINLVGNAIKFTGEGSVEVRAQGMLAGAGAVMLTIEVADTGIGIPEDKIAYVFESFTQQHAAISRSYGGTGLGLAIVRQLVELQGGTVDVESAAGVGSTFTVQIPFEVSVEGAQTAERPGSDLPDNLPLLVGISVLVAEDNVINQKVVRNTLLRQGAEVDIVDNGRQAVDRLVGGAHYDCVLMDLQMPEMDGYEATETIRKKLHSTVPIIAMTADALKGEDERTRAAGMTGFISKPFEPADLYQKILAAAMPRGHAPERRIPIPRPNAPVAPPPPPQPVQPASVLDLAYLRELSADDEEYIREVVRIFLGSTPAGLQDLASSIEAEATGVDIARQAHALKSSFGIVRVHGILERLSKLEELATTGGSHADLKSQMEGISAIFSYARRELEAILNGAPLAAQTPATRRAG